MRVAILHYHLRPGGVTRVIDNTVQSLAGTQVQLALLTGEEPSGDFHDGLVRTVPAIGYQQDGDPRALLSELDLAASQMLGERPIFGTSTITAWGKIWPCRKRPGPLLSGAIRSFYSPTISPKIFADPITGPCLMEPALIMRPRFIAGSIPWPTMSTMPCSPPETGMPSPLAACPPTGFTSYPMPLRSPGPGI